MLHIVRKIYPNVKAVFFDTGLEYPEIRQFVKSYGDSVVWLRPEINFRHVIEKFGYPFISKEISQCVYEVLKPMSEGKDVTNYAQYKRLCGNYSENGFMDREKYKFFLDAPFWISHKCCIIMKKKPSHTYMRQTGRKPITAQMASESRLRTQKWLQNGCNAFDANSPISNPMSFWTEQDVLQYLRNYDIPYASVYGEIKEDENGKLYTTGCDRTGCVFCGFGCHLEKEPNRFQRLKQTHPQLWEYCMKDWENGGLGMKNVLEYINVKTE